MRRAALLALAAGCLGCLRAPPCEPDGLCLTAMPVALRPVDRALGSADIDGDGHVDLVSVGGLGAALRRGGGDGSLSAPLVWTLPAEAEGLALGDLDGDGAQDLVTALPSRKSLAWLRGAVGGPDAAALEFDVDVDVQALLAADLNGDGADELIASARDSGRLYLWMGAASGPSTARYVELGGEAIALSGGDFRGDRGLEVAAAIPSLGAVALFELSPTVGLERAGTAWASAFPASLVAADLDEDGHDDLAAIDTLDRTLWVGLGDGAGGWQREHSWPLAETPWQLFARRGAAGRELGVISGDHQGVTLIDPLSGAVRIQAIASGGLQAVVAGDFAAGGSDELVYLNGTASMVEERAGFRAEARWTAPGSELTGPVAVLDLEGDGVPELVVEDPSKPALVVFAAAGPGYVEVARHPLSDALGGLLPLARADGGADLVWWRREWFGMPSSFGVLTYTPGAGLEDVSIRSYDAPILDIVAADRDGDGWADLAVTVDQGDEEGHQALVFVRREPAGGLTIAPSALDNQFIGAVVAAQIDGVGGEDLYVIIADAVWALVGDQDKPALFIAGWWPSPGGTFVSADLDGDEQADLVNCRLDGVIIAYGHPDWTIDPPVTISPYPCERLTACDLDADGDLDLVVERAVPGALRDAVEVLRSDPDGWQATGAFADAPALSSRVTTCRGQQLLQWSGSRRGATLREVVAGPGLREARLPAQFGMPVLAADLDGDGLDDLFTHNVYTLTVARADGEGSYQPMQNIAMPLAEGHYVVELVPAELDGRPGRELLARIKQTGIDETSWVVWSLRATELVALGGLATGFTTLGDFDGDGRDELFIAGASPRLVWLGADGSTTRTLPLDPDVVSSPFGVRAADMDGDGLDDLLTRGREGGDIEVLRSSGGGGFEAPRSWQISGQIETLGLGDVDGDGARDIVVVDHLAPSPALVVARGDGEGGMLAVARSPLPDGTFFSSITPLVDDIDGDGRAEIVSLVGDFATPATLQVLRPDAREANPPWRPDALLDGDAIVRVQLTRDDPAWVVIGDQGAIVLTTGGGR